MNSYPKVKLKAVLLLWYPVFNTCEHLEEALGGCPWGDGRLHQLAAADHHVHQPVTERGAQALSLSVSCLTASTLC